MMRRTSPTMTYDVIMSTLCSLALLQLGLSPVTLGDEDISIVEIEDLLKQLVRRDHLADLYATIPSAPAEGQETMTTDQLEAFLDDVVTQMTGNNLPVKVAKPSRDYGQPPHVFLFLIDDLGFSDVSWNNPEVITPKMEALAQEGVILDYNYVHAICSPSRGALMTGKYSCNLGMQHGVITFQAPECAPKDTMFISERLKEVGYTTSLIGKWHLGFCDITCTPLHRGFDSFYGFYQPYEDHYSHQSGFAGETGFDFRDGFESVPHCTNGTYLTDLLTARAIRDIQNHDPQNPLFMYFAHAGVHTPIQVPHRFEEMYSHVEDEWKRKYLGMASAVDESIGEVVAAIKEAGMYENSIIIVSSDNGGNSFIGNNFPLRGGKESLYEGGTRVPGFFHSPLQTFAGWRSKEMIHITDWHATIARLAGVNVDDHLDGVDQTEMLLHGGDSARWMVLYNADAYYPQYNGHSGIRIGDYKLLQGFPGLFDGWQQSGGVGYTHQLDLLHDNPEVRDDQWWDLTAQRRYQEIEEIARKLRDTSLLQTRDYIPPDYDAIDAYIVKVEGYNQLYNVVDDPEEFSNLAHEFPGLVRLLQKFLDKYARNARPVDIDNTYDVPEASPTNYGGVWESGWC